MRLPVVIPIRKIIRKIADLPLTEKGPEEVAADAVQAISRAIGKVVRFE